MGSFDYSDVSVSPYSVGPLLYSPANSDKILRQIKHSKIHPPYSIALCLEDAIADAPMDEAEAFLLRTLREIASLSQAGSCYIPKTFIRVRTPAQALALYRRAEEGRKIITGFIFPKFQAEGADACREAMAAINEEALQKVWMMPILESHDIISLLTRREALGAVKEKIDSMRELVLNVRVGGNDFCSCFGLRRSVSHTIYDIGVVRDCILDILNVFSMEYVVSAPVWEYFDTYSGDAWRQGLQKELSLDRQNGFIGKTAIHPSQVAVIQEALKVLPEDFADAQQLMGFDQTRSGVEKARAGGRMNEAKTHMNWAKKTLELAAYYGIKEVL